MSSIIDSIIWNTVYLGFKLQREANEWLTNDLVPSSLAAIKELLTSSAWFAFAWVSLLVMLQRCLLCSECSTSVPRLCTGDVWLHSWMDCQVRGIWHMTYLRRDSISRSSSILWIISSLEKYIHFWRIIQHTMSWVNMIYTFAIQYESQ